MDAPAAPERWREQWDRLGRRYNRFQELNQGIVHEVPSEHYVDDVLSFFMDCWHLKDWLRNDPASGLTKDELDEMTLGSNNLRLCADLANGTKHLKLTHWKAAPDARFGPRHYAVGLSVGEPTTIAVKATVAAGNNAYDAFELGTACVEEWKAFLSQKGLL